jgi:CubicO group peptidase (beta-lactamase class C family)
MTGGGVKLQSRDIAKIAGMMADDGRWDGRQVVPSSWIDAMLTVRRKSRPDQNYGYFVFEGDYKTACGELAPNLGPPGLQNSHFVGFSAGR